MNRYIWTEAQSKKDIDIRYLNGQPKPNNNLSEKTEYDVKYISLASEIAFSSGNGQSNEVEVSLAKRFPFLLYNKISDSISDDEFDVLMHYIADLDLKSGLEYSNIRKNIIENGILTFRYGRKVRELYKRFDRETKDIVLDCIFKFEMGSMDSFIHSVRSIVGKCVFYTSEKVIILYMKEKTADSDDIIELCRILFLPVGVELKVHYKYHIGIICNDAAMRIGHIRIL